MTETLGMIVHRLKFKPAKCLTFTGSLYDLIKILWVQLFWGHPVR